MVITEVFMDFLGLNQQRHNMRWTTKKPDIHSNTGF